MPAVKGPFKARLTIGVGEEGGNNCFPNFDRNGRFQAISTETFRQFVGQGKICVLHTVKFGDKYVAQNVGNGILGRKISKSPRVAMPSDHNPKNVSFRAK